MMPSYRLWALGALAFGRKPPAPRAQRPEPCLEFSYQLLQCGEPRLERAAAALCVDFFRRRGRQKLPVGALDDGRDLLELAFESLSRRHELRHDGGERLARHVIVPGKQRLAP